MRYDKLSPGLLLAVHDLQIEGTEGLTRQARSLALIPAVGVTKPARVVVFLYCDPQADLSHLTQYGVRVNQTSGRIRTAILPVTSLDPVSEDPAIERIRASRYLNPTMDVALDRVNVPAFQQRTGLRGQNVVIGIIDSGIDPNHPAFAGRILRIWDQTLRGPGVREGGYGLEVSGATLTASRDPEGHGTHVAGIAAGRHPTYGGVAPDADLVIVKTNFQETSIADGIRYCFRIAEDLNRPAVANLSLGGHFDPHDGTDPLSLSIDEASGPGRIVCCAAGNEGNDNIHGQQTIAPGETKAMRFLVPSNTVPVALLNGWYNGDARLEVAVRTPDRFITPFQPVITQGDPTRTYALADAQVEIVTPGADAINGDFNFFGQLRGVRSNAAVKGGIWQLVVRNGSGVAARLDVWTLDGQPAPQVIFTGKSVQDSLKVGSPGAAASVITVAAYTTKVQWTDIRGRIEQVGLELNDIADFSSEGPLRKGQPKPEVAAPGAMIVSALSADSAPAEANAINPEYVVQAGTSMACPFVAGLVALLLQQDATRSPADIKALLQANSLIPGKPAGMFDPKWGYGLIDAQKL